MAANTRDQPSNWVAMVAALIPGGGQWYLERYMLGAVFFVAFVTALNGLWLGSILESVANPEAIWWTALTALALVWVASAGHTYRCSFGTDRDTLARNRELLVRTALIDYLRDDLADAARKLEHAIQLDVDWLDPDPLFHLGVVKLRQAERLLANADRDGARQARRRSQWAFRTCLARDPVGKWRNEVVRESRRMRRLLDTQGAAGVLTTSGRFVRVDRDEESGELDLSMISGTRLSHLRDRLEADGPSPLPPPSSGTIRRPPSKRMPMTRVHKRLRARLAAEAAEAARPDAAADDAPPPGDPNGDLPDAIVDPVPPAPADDTPPADDAAPADDPATTAEAATEDASGTPAPDPDETTAEGPDEPSPKRPDDGPAPPGEDA